MTTTTEAPSLIDAAHALYKERAPFANLTTRAIGVEMGMSHEWVKKFLANEIHNPGVRSVEAFIQAIKNLTDV